MYSLKHKILRALAQVFLQRLEKNVTTLREMGMFLCFFSLKKQNKWYNI